MVFSLYFSPDWCPQISKGFFFPWLDGFWHFNKVSIYLSIYLSIYKEVSWLCWVTHRDFLKHVNGGFLNSQYLSRKISNFENLSTKMWKFKKLFNECWKFNILWQLRSDHIRDVTKISSCWVNTTSRQGIKQLGISFGSIFLLFSNESSQGPHL